MSRTTIFGVSDTVLEVVSLVACVAIIVLLLAAGAVILVRVLARVRPKQAAAARNLHWFLMLAGLAAGPAAGLLYWAAWGWLGGYASEEQRIGDLWGFLEAGILVGVSGCVAMWLRNVAFRDARRQETQSQIVTAQPSYRQEVVSTQDSCCFECLAVAGVE